ncbi:MAG: hypothetical protein KDI11_08160 [Alphaproteobacteria bacterium]|nr:hypothetical protein [Alphaproteobacteria bacterium]
MSVHKPSDLAAHFREQYVLEMLEKCYRQCRLPRPADKTEEHIREKVLREKGEVNRADRNPGNVVLTAESGSALDAALHRHPEPVEV